MRFFCHNKTGTTRSLDEWTALEIDPLTPEFIEVRQEGETWVEVNVPKVQEIEPDPGVPIEQTAVEENAPKKATQRFDEESETWVSV
jgi:hypothetical protein